MDQETKEALSEGIEMGLEAVKLAVHKLAQEDDYFCDVAAIYKKLYDKLMCQGFEESQAMRIITNAQILNNNNFSQK